MADKIIPAIAEIIIIIVKQRFACSLFCSPKSLATSALPPLPSIKPMPPRIEFTGIIRFIAA
ncbi:MAG: hypothetical protein NC120_11935, partial [Ruminococcus sp.]|nr:hypothetical protein [Ruminococcus sp.]